MLRIFLGSEAATIQGCIILLFKCFFFVMGNRLPGANFLHKDLVLLFVLKFSDKIRKEWKLCVHYFNKVVSLKLHTLMATSVIIFKSGFLTSSGCCLKSTKTIFLEVLKKKSSSIFRMKTFRKNEVLGKACLLKSFECSKNVLKLELKFYFE